MLTPALFFLVVCGSAAETNTAGFEDLFEDDGISVSVRARPGYDMPTFRGETLVPSSMLQILAVFRDRSTHTEWMHRCVEAEILERYGKFEALLYNRTDAPWPVWDRDVVIHAKFTFDLVKKEAWNRFHAVEHALKPPVEGVVRMTKLVGFYHLIYVDDHNTVVVYQIDADPAGSLPRWLARRASRKLPYQTLYNLREQVLATKGRYDDLIARWVEQFDLASVPR